MDFTHFSIGIFECDRALIVISGRNAVVDCLKKIDYQIVIAESEGARCALNIVRRINNE